MIAETEADGRNLGDTSHPGFETGDFVRLVNRLEGIDKIARNRDDLRLFMLNFLSDLVKIFFGRIAKMNIANRENGMFFLVGFVEAIACVIEILHG
jgi:hypothetical protein